MWKILVSSKGIAFAQNLFVIAVAAALPWSTSLSAVLIALWLISRLIAITFETVEREDLTAAAMLPVLLWLLAAAGMLWADVPWKERLAGLDGFHKLLAISFLMAQFRRYYKSPWGLTWNVNAGECVLFAFLISATILLFVSWALVLVPGLPWRGRTFGVPVKDYVAQSGIFVLCAFVLFHYALHFRMRKGWLATLSLILAAMFIASVAYIATSRTAIAVFTVLLFLFGMWHFGWKGIFGSLLIVVLIGSLLWSSSDHFRGQVLGTIDGAEGSSRSFISASTVVRLEIWKRSLELLMQSPLIGHGTGTIAHLFGVPAQETTAPVRLITGNPHNEIFRVGIQIGLVGIAALIAMWISHLMLFHNAGSLGWVGTVVVTQNIVSSLFNSHLADFTQGWLYVFGVGVVGGMVLSRQKLESIAAEQRAA